MILPHTLQGYHALLPCSGTLLFIWSQRPTLSYSGKILGSRPFVFVGKISYALYLWHWPIYVMLLHFKGDAELSSVEAVGGLLASFAAACFSTFLVEPAFRLPKPAFPRSCVAFFVPLAWCMLVMFSYMAWSTDAIGGIPSGSLKAVNTSVPAEFSSCGNRTCLVYWNETEVDLIYDVDYADVEVGNILASKGWEGGRFNYQRHGRPYLVGRKLLPGHFPSIAVLGSSHCEMYGPLLEELALEYDVSVGFLCIGGY